MSQSIFRKQSLDRVNSPEELNDYIRTANPGAWLTVAAAVILLVSVLVWGIFGSLDSTTAANGLASGESVTCYIADASEIRPGNTVRIGGLEGEVLSVSEKPVSLAAAQEMLTLAGVDEYTLWCLQLGEWNYTVEVSVPGLAGDGFVSVDIVTETINPISFILD